MDAATVIAATHIGPTMSPVDTAIARIKPIAKAAIDRPVGQRFLTTSTPGNPGGRAAELGCGIGNFATDTDGLNPWFGCHFDVDT